MRPRRRASAAEGGTTVSIGDDMRHLLEHPTVEYIPLDIVSVSQGDTPAGDGSSNLMVAADARDMTDWPVPPENAAEVSLDGAVALLGIGMELLRCAYRGHKVSILGRLAPGRFHLAKVTAVYFYQEDLVFVVYDRDGEVIGESTSRIPWPGSALRR